VRRKLDEFVNHRQDVPLRRLSLHNSGAYNWPASGTPGQPGWVPPTLPETYYDFQPIEAEPPAPGTITGPGFRQGVTWTSNPSSLGQLKAGAGFGDLYFHDVNTKTITATLDATQPTPLVVEIDFDTSHGGTIGATFGNMDFDHLRIRLALTLSFDPAGGRVDVLSWWPELDGLRKSATPVGSDRTRLTGHFLGQAIDETMPTLLVEEFLKELTGRVVDVDLETSSTFDPGGALQKKMRERLFAMFGSVPDRFAPQTTLRDQINAKVNSWLLGGANGSRVSGLQIDGDDLVISYTGPARTWAPAKPSTVWPPAGFTPGTLANIDHIVALTMENRSFDHMLGYLSLPPSKGGRGRTDVDGLKGGEINYADGVACPSFPLPAGDTNFAPDPPHGYEPVARAIDGGAMDGFAQSYLEQGGAPVAARIMGYHTAANVPVYDALARDFAIGHRWFASHPGPTFCNRFYELTGRLNIDPDGVWEYDNSSPLRPVFTPTIFDALTAHGVSWRYFEHGYCFLRFFEQHTFDATNITAFDDPGLGFENLELRRAAGRRRARPEARPARGRGRRLEPGVGQDPADRHLRRARRLLRPRAAARGRQGRPRVAADLRGARARGRHLPVGARRQRVRPRRPRRRVRPHLDPQDDRAALHAHEPAIPERSPRRRQRPLRGAGNPGAAGTVPAVHPVQPRLRRVQAAA
jgi:hypothetical protein